MKVADIQVGRTYMNSIYGGKRKVTEIYVAQNWVAHVDVRHRQRGRQSMFLSAFAQWAGSEVKP